MVINYFKKSYFVLPILFSFLVFIFVGANQVQDKEKPLPKDQVSAEVSVPAFPGAGGGGAVSVGGRGGRVIEVTNLNNSGSGSLRACIDATGPRTCVFRVGGTINITTPLNIRNSYITIAGQTAPGGGILIKANENAYSAINVFAHDVVIQYLKIRHGYGNEEWSHHAIFVRNGSYNVIVDHSSLSWATDENATVYATDGSIDNVTFSWNLIAEGLQPASGPNSNHHSCGLIVGSNYYAERMDNVSVHHNFFAHHMNRNPLVKGKSHRVINNIAYNWSYWALGFFGGVEIDIIGNKFKRGPSLNGHDYDILWRSDVTSKDSGPTGEPSIYIKGNDGAHISRPEDDNWQMIDEVVHWRSQGRRPDRKYERLVPRQDSQFPITIHPVENLENVLFPTVGASQRLNENGQWVSNRDSVDSRLINDYKNGTGKIISHENEVGGFPAIASGTPYPDSDHDGMSDAWETKYFGNLSQGSASVSSSDYDNDGFTDLEEFLNGTNPKGDISTLVGDFDGDSDLDINDIALMLAVYTQLSVPVNSSNSKFDVDNNDKIDITDIAIVLSYYTQLVVR